MAFKKERDVSTEQSLSWKEIEQKLDQRSPVNKELRAQTPRLLRGRGSAEDPVLLAPRLFRSRLTRIA